MEAAVIDTLRYARRLRDAGVPPEQAKAMAEALSDKFVHNLATKADLDAAITGLGADMAALEARLTWRLLGGVTVIAGLAVALIELG